LNSPLIKDGALSLDSRGLLVSGPDIQTQMPVTLVAYRCMYDDKVNSGLIPYLDSIPIDGFSTNQISYIVSSAYAPIMISQQLISDLTIGVKPFTIDASTVYIKIKATDKEGSPITLNWINP
jgi:hypothetical protein